VSSTRLVQRAHVFCTGAALCALGGLLAATVQGCTRETYDHYRSRGLVRAVDGRGSEVSVAIQHEAIASFKDREGKAAPMASMTMLFGLDERLERGRLAPGDKLTFEFDVRWELRPTLLMTSFEHLPSDATLDLTESAHGER
jgi:Cu/Ag efflux protein CusF